jgi:hypothetical protein
VKAKKARSTWDNEYPGPINLNCTPKVSPRPEHDIHDETHDQAHLHAPPERIDVSVSLNAAKMGSAYEKTVLSGVSRACPLSQNAAGFGALRKKKGRRGKKKPMMMPLSTARARESLSADPPLAPLPLPRASIHCSSSARACSSSVQGSGQGLETSGQGRSDVGAVRNAHSSSVGNSAVAM